MTQMVFDILAYSFIVLIVGGCVVVAVRCCSYFGDLTNPPEPPATEQVAADALRTDGLLAEQRHQYLDLDTDSTTTVPGAVPMCPPRTGEAA